MLLQEDYLDPAIYSILIGDVCICCPKCAYILVAPKLTLDKYHKHEHRQPELY